MKNHLPIKSLARKTLLAAMCMVATVMSSYAQKWTNVAVIGQGGGSEFGRGSCTDASGNVYTIGTYSAAGTDFDGSGAVSTLPLAGVTDVFITKYNSSGAFQWAATCGGPSQDQGFGITTDGTNVFITGRYAGTGVFGATSLPTTGGTDIFIASLNAGTGAFQWAKNFGSTSSDVGQALCLDGGNGLYFSGTFNTSMTFGTFPLSAQGGSGNDMVIAKLDKNNGNVTWAVSGGSSGNFDNGGGSSICYHPGLNEVIVTGAYFGANAVYGGFNLSNSGGNEMVLLEVNASTGAFLQAYGFGGSSGADDEMLGVCYDPVTQDVFATGYFEGNITFPGNAQLTGSGGNDLFVLRYAPATNTFVWSVNGGSTDADRGNAICSNNAGSVYVAGYYSGALSFGSVNLPATVAAGILVGGLSVTDGTRQWAISADGNDPLRTDQAYSISTGGPAGKIAVCGQFGGSSNFGSIPGTSAGNVDIFIAQLAAGLVVTASATDPSCDNGCNGTATAAVSGGVPPYNYSWSPSGGAAATATGLCPGNYTVTVTDAVSQSVMKSATVNPPVVSIANEDAANTGVNISATNTIIASASCKLIAKVVPNGANPISGNTVAFVKVALTVPVFPAVNGKPYVQRHFQITPSTGAATATGRVTLYFKQSEFDAFNAHAGATLKLPMNSGDAGGKANVRIGKYPGSSSDGSGLPGTYTGAATVIDPNDADIVFNLTENRWEISFDAVGFSGFVLQTAITVLPVTWLNVTALTDPQGRAQIRWEVEESNVAAYVVERSSNGSTFAAANTQASKGDGRNNYTFTEAAAVTGRTYYRIRQTDKDGRTTFSQVLIVNNVQGGTVTAYPNPTDGNITLNITDRSLMNTVAKLYNSDGRELQQIYISQTATTVSLARYVKGAYLIRLSNGETIRIIRK
ncbi:T9SS type A sorting domain-containing protein [Pseudoflavitalea sp. G-6-1-2]|uniref:T9SS type A sorting domain-containing protein n=1 Tax=Pseudoflavitalea sp. G-6-1-2 TaxID=2728841 RepID=UPI00146A9A8A|nr:T9SS type A sorting domain-containing protein [Pseudoflavitalea sp. G-6-1-2]NML22093.1 T9SS type A sorting domain-containing protein [Pseudoflavitalea sp. G-6-1-2]